MHHMRMKIQKTHFQYINVEPRFKVFIPYRQHIKKFGSNVLIRKKRSDNKKPILKLA